MQFSTTPTLEGQTIVEYCGVVTGEAILGANIFCRYPRYRWRTFRCV